MHGVLDIIQILELHDRCYYTGFHAETQASQSPSVAERRNQPP